MQTDEVPRCPSLFESVMLHYATQIIVKGTGWLPLKHIKQGIKVAHGNNEHTEDRVGVSVSLRDFHHENKPIQIY